MKQSTQDLITYLEQNTIKYARHSDNEDVLVLGFNTGRASLLLAFTCDEHTVQLSCRLPFSAQPEQLDAVKDYFTRINYFLKTGCFELDVRDGEMSMRNATFLADGRLSAEQTALLLITTTRTTEQYIGGLQDILFRQVAPSAAVKDAQAWLESSVPPGVLVC